MEKYGRIKKKIPKEANSMSKFVGAFHDDKPEGNFNNERCIFAPITMESEPFSSKLSLKRPLFNLAPISNKENLRSNKRKQFVNLRPKPFGEIEYLPVPKKKPLFQRSQPLEYSQSSKPQVPSKRRPERELVAITGSVRFVLKNFKMYPNLKGLYEVYGNILKINKSKIRFEHIVLMRSESGPILQGFYYDFGNILLNFQTGSLVRSVGNFNTQNRFHIHKIQQVPEPPPDGELTRIQNVTAFALLQN